MEEMTIVVVSCDAYKDIVELYLEFLEKNWSDCPYRIIVVFETEKLEGFNAESYACGEDTTWTQRAIMAVNKAKTNYILLTVDDLFIGSKVNTREFINVLKFIKYEKIKYYRIPTFKVIGQRVTLHPRNTNVELIPSDRVYGVTFGSSIWEKNELLKVLGNGDKSAWDMENDFTKKAINSLPGFIEGYVADTRYLLHSIHTIKSGKWLPEAVNVLNEKGYCNIDFSIRGIVPKITVLKWKLYMFGNTVCPSKCRFFVKKVLSKFGLKFATKY